MLTQHTHTTIAPSQHIYENKYIKSEKKSLDLVAAACSPLLLLPVQYIVLLLYSTTLILLLLRKRFSPRQETCYMMYVVTKSSLLRVYISCYLLEAFKQRGQKKIPYYLSRQVCTQFNAPSCRKTPLSESKHVCASYTVYTQCLSLQLVLYIDVIFLLFKKSKIYVYIRLLFIVQWKAAGKRIFCRLYVTINLNDLYKVPWEDSQEERAES